MRYSFVLVVFAVLAASTGCNSQRTAGAAIDKAMLPLVPPDTKVLADLKLDKLKTTPLYQRHAKDLAFPLMQGSTERIGIDPQKDVMELLMAWNGKDALFLVRGRFDPAQVSQKLTALHAPQTMYKNHQIFGDAKNSVAFLSKDLAVEGDAQDVQRTLDLAGSSTNNVPEELRNRLHQIPGENQIWLVSQGLPFADMPMRSDVQSALSNITGYISGVTAGVMVDAGTHFKIDLTCLSDQGAKRVHDALRGVIGFGRLSTRDNQPELLQVYDGVNVDQDKSMVHVHADYSGELTDKLFEQLGQFAPAMRPSTH